MFDSSNSNQLINKESPKPLKRRAKQGASGLVRDERSEAHFSTATKLRTPPPEVSKKRPKSYIPSLTEVVDIETGERQGDLSKDEVIKQSRRLRFDRLDVASRVLKGFHSEPIFNDKGFEVTHRTCSCNKLTTGKDVQILKSKTNGKSKYGGVMNCASVWTCPVCSSVINERKSNDLRVGFNLAMAEGLNISLLTFTAPHTSNDCIETMADQMTDALQRFWRGEPAKRFKQRYGIVGNVRAFEVTFGERGPHPHFHIVLFSEKELPFTKTEKNRFGRRRVLSIEKQHNDWVWVLDRWKTCCKAAGLSEPNEYGMDLQNGSQAAEYISKFGTDGDHKLTKSGDVVNYDFADEVTKGHQKTAKNKENLTPFQILDEIDNMDLDPKIRKSFRHLFLDYARAFKNKAQLKWSKGLRKKLDMPKEKKDEEILKDETDSMDVLCFITVPEWREIIKKRHRAYVLELAENGGSEAVANYLNVPFEQFNNRNHLTQLDDVVIESLAFERLAHVKERRKLKQKDDFEKQVLVEKDSDINDENYLQEREKSFFEHEVKRYENWFVTRE